MNTLQLPEYIGRRTTDKGSVATQIYNVHAVTQADNNADSSSDGGLYLLPRKKS